VSGLSRLEVDAALAAALHGGIVTGLARPALRAHRNHESAVSSATAGYLSIFLGGAGVVGGARRC